MKIPRNEIIDNLSMLRVNHDMSVRQLAEQIKIAPGTLVSYEGYFTRMPLVVAMAIADYYGYEIKLVKRGKK